MARFINPFTKEEDECETGFERWIYTLKNMETLERMPFKARKAVFEKLEKIVDIASLSKEDREKYDESIKVYRDYLATEAYAKQREAKFQAKEAKQEAKDAEQEAKDAEQEAKDAEQEARDAEQEARDAELKAKEIEQKARDAELKAKNDEQKARDAELKAREAKINAQAAGVSLDIIRNMKAKGLSLEEIAEITGLTHEQIRRL